MDVASREKARGGRSRDDVWAHFDRAAEGKGFKAVCTYCKTGRQGKVDFLYRHLVGFGVFVVFF